MPVYPAYYTYKTSTPSVFPAEMIDDVRTHLRLSMTYPSDAYLTMLINAAIECGQNYTRRVFFTTGFTTYLDYFEREIELKRSPLIAVSSFEYKVSGSFTTVDSSLYYQSLETDYSKIILNQNKYYPTDGDSEVQSIKIIFTAGYGTEISDIPPSIYLAILNHIAALYENRGDCDAASIASSLPNTSRAIYNSFRLIDVSRQ
jgi:uncharacterized phiE125 gp8 family phage protein